MLRIKLTDYLFVLITVLLISCNGENSKVNESFVTTINREEQLDSILYLLSNAHYNLDTAKGNDAFFALVDEKEKVFSRLLIDKGSVEISPSYFWVCFNKGVHPSGIYRTVCDGEGALYLGYSLVFNDYYFSNERILSSKSTPGHLRIISQKEDVAKGWEILEEWYDKSKSGVGVNDDSLKVMLDDNNLEWGLGNGVVLK